MLLLGESSIPQKDHCQAGGDFGEDSHYVELELIDCGIMEPKDLLEIFDIDRSARGPSFI